jgi:Fibronectin type III domain
LPASQFTFTDSTVTGGKEYSYHVTASNQRGGESQPSISFKVVPITTPSGMAAPTEVTHDLTSITVEWLPPTQDGDSDVTKYVLMMKAEYQTQYTQVYSGHALSYRAVLLQPGFEYRFKVRAVNLAGPSSVSQASDAIITALFPDAPSGLTLVARSSLAITFRWTSPVNTGGVKLSGYHIYMAANSDDFALVSDAPSLINPTFTEHT